MGVGGQLHAPVALPPRNRPCTHFTGGWVGPRAGLDVPFCSGGQNSTKIIYIIFLDCRVFPHVIPVLYHSGASNYGSCLQLLSLSCANNTMIMHNGSELLSESTSTYRSSVLGITMRACDWSKRP
jgi:hypothetical protein